MAYNLPPGCTDADVDRAMGGPDPIVCGNCGAENDPSCDECCECGESLVETESEYESEDWLDRADWEYDRDR